jgi:pantothenate kinase-related protein Tda10
MKNSIDYKEFVKYVHKQFKDRIEIKDVETLLSLEEDYNKDNPASLGKSLVLNRLLFTGKKLDGQPFTYDRPLYEGVNVWIADNGKGKSTVFKVIKYALTGRNSIKPDIKEWIEEIYLEFRDRPRCLHYRD